MLVFAFGKEGLVLCCRKRCRFVVLFRVRLLFYGSVLIFFFGCDLVGWRTEGRMDGRMDGAEGGREEGSFRGRGRGCIYR